MLPRILFACLALAYTLCAQAPAAPPDSRLPTPDSLHQRIDSLIESAAIGPLAPLCSDADFVRRIYLDLTGVIPTAQQARDFVADTSPDKRQKLIDHLLASPQFLRYMTITLDVMLMERKPEKVVKQPEWETYLYTSLASDKPLDQLFRELIVGQTFLSATSPAAAPPARFLLDRDAEPNLLTRDIGRLVFGMDLQCCQCHDHPLIDDYYQDDYYGLFAFVHRTSLFTDTKTKQISLTEKADGEASFKSVFTGASSDKAQPRLPKGAVLFLEPTFPKGDEYSVKPDKTVRGIPKFSRRAALAELLPTSREFSRNLANRLWAHMLGRGLVHPLDFHYSANPPSNPELLTLLAEELRSTFQLRPFLRHIALSRTYQRSCDPPKPDTLNFADIAARIDRLAAVKKALQNQIQPHKDALAAAKADFKTTGDLESRLAAELPKLEAAVVEARISHEKALEARKSAELAVTQLREQSQAIRDAAARLADVAAELSDDSILADAAGKTSALAAELDAALEKSNKSLADRLTEETTATTQLNSAQQVLNTALTERPTLERLRDLEHAQLSAGHRLSDATYALAAIDARSARAQAIIDYSALAKIDPVKAGGAWNSIVQQWTIAGQIAPLKPLTSEQLAASTMQATGNFPSVALSKKAQQKVAAYTTHSPDTQARSASEGPGSEHPPHPEPHAEQLALLAKLRGTFTEFTRQYGGLPGEEFQATVGQALFVANGPTIDNWLKPSGQSLIARLSSHHAPRDVPDIADDLYWSIFSRTATETEKQSTLTYLKDRTDKPAALAEIAWALLSSTEFRFNH